MAIRSWATAWLALQLLQHTAVTVDPESCTEIETPDPVINEAALLQASVGKGRVTLVEEETPADTVPVPQQPELVTPKSSPLLSGHSVRVKQGSASAAARPEDVSVMQEPLVLADTSQEPVESGVALLARSSVMSMMQRIAQGIREEFPASLVYIFPALKTDIGAVFGLSLASFIIWCTLVAAIACFYRSQKAFPRAVSSRPEQDFNDWTSGPFDVFSEPSVCCWSVCCPCIRWADNMDMLGILGFWVALMLFCGLVLLNTVPAGGLLLWLIASLLWMSFRQQLRLKFDMEQNTLKTFVGDCALYCCCWPCAIAQEARHIEEACRADHKAVRTFQAV